ncbi:hypothetical protein M569_08958, partial [Genlisea aurea]
LKAKFRVAFILLITLWLGLVGFYSLSKPISNGCAMTYMYPTYIPIPMLENVAFKKYGLYLYHEGWRKIDFNDHIRKLSGVPVLFIPGNVAKCLKTVRSLGAESHRAYQGGPLRLNLYEAFPNFGEGEDFDFKNISLPNKYNTVLDWFTVDLEGEHSAMDGRILQEHSEYVVYAIHRILDQYKESHNNRARAGASVAVSQPKSVILVGHSMGGFVARAAVVHPNLRKFAVETIVTLSTPHLTPPVPFQPSLSHYYESVNREWRKGYMICTSQKCNGHLSVPSLSHVVVISISGGYNDYQVRTKLEFLDGIVPDSHGFMISSVSMKNVWLSMEHQVILWCNQLVVQVSHTLLSLIDMKTGQPFSDSQQRLGIFVKMLQNGIPKNFISMKQSHQPSDSLFPLASKCPNDVWNEDELQKDFYIQDKTLTILAMDGRRRWLDIEKLSRYGKDYFVFVTNLSPCTEVRLHLWPGRNTSASDSLPNTRGVEVTSKMIRIPSGPTPRQIEPGSQTEQAPPSYVFWLDPLGMHGFRFLTISVAPRPTVSGGPPPAVSMGIGQFFEPKEGNEIFSSDLLIRSLYKKKHLNLGTDHPLVVNLKLSFSIGLLPLSLSLTPTDCGIQNSGILGEDSEDLEADKVCRLRCFPPVALAWDATSGLHVFPNLYSETLVVDSFPALWSPSQDTEKTSILLLVDPHCSYKTALGVSLTGAAGRFLLLYYSEVCGLCFAVVFFALMRQAYAWDFDMPVPSILFAVESNLRLTKPLLFLAVMPIIIAISFPSLLSQSPPPPVSFSTISVLCYAVSNGIVVLVTLLSQFLFFIAGCTHAFVKKRLQLLETNARFPRARSCSDFCSKAVRILQLNAVGVTLSTAVAVTCLVHPALGLFVSIISHASRCH